jgi:acid phosphatase family membrane protein YuiD
MRPVQMAQTLLNGYNQPLVAALLAALCAQLVKGVIALITGREQPREAVRKAGGMPSSHSALALALLTSVAWHHGWDSPVTAVAGIVAVIVIYDAAVVRRAIQEQTRAVHLLLERVAPEQLEAFRIPRSLGHTGREVTMGMLTGVAVARVVLWIGGL